MSNARFSVIPQKAVRDLRITDSQLRTLSALGMYGDKNGWCFPKQATLGEDVGKNQQNISKDIIALVNLGYLQSFPQYDPVTNARMQNRYRIVFDFPEDTLSSQSDDSPTQIVERKNVDNAPLNAPYNTATGENTPLPVTLENLPVEWQIAAGQKKIVPQNIFLAHVQDSANLISMGTGSFQDRIFDLAYAFMVTRNILIPEEKAKGNRKAAREMVKQHVEPHHIVDAVHAMLNHKPKPLTCVDLFSVSKIAIDLANPAPADYTGVLEGV
jgi:hypothetical protein